MALGIISLAALGLIMVHVKLTLQTQFELFHLRKSIGITILLAAFLRIA